MRMASSTTGKAKKTSSTRMMIWSVLPPAYPATKPSAKAITAAMTVGVTLTKRERRPP